jgi:hypothetical protein
MLRISWFTVEPQKRTDGRYQNFGGVGKNQSKILCIIYASRILLSFLPSSNLKTNLFALIRY